MNMFFPFKITKFERSLLSQPWIPRNFIFRRLITNVLKLHIFLTQTGKHLSKIDKSAKILTSKKQQSTKNWSTRKWSTSLKSNLSIKVPLTNISLCLYKHTNNGISILYSVMHLRLKIMYQKQDRKTFFQMHYWRF